MQNFAALLGAVFLLIFKNLRGGRISAPRRCAGFKAMGENPIPSYIYQIRLFKHELIYIRLMLMIKVQNFGDLHRGHMGSPEIANRFLPINHECKELEISACPHCACLVKKHRLICSMAYLGQHVTSRDLELRPNVDLTVQSHHTCPRAIHAFPLAFYLG